MQSPRAASTLHFVTGVLSGTLLGTMIGEHTGNLQVGSIFHGRYEVVRRIKAGGMGALYEVIHLETKRRRALKVMHPNIVSNPGMRARFALEATVAADIHSEHIVETFDAGIDKETGTPFLVMELLQGEEVAVVLRRRGRFFPRQVITLLGQAALGLDKTHAANIVHRDLKPENLFLTRRDDGSPRLKILDFGIAKVIAGDESTATQALGTPLYMPPEQMRGGALSPATDNYALAHIAFRLLVGGGYWDLEKEQLGNNVALILRISEGLPEPASQRAARMGVSLPRAFDGWFAKATAIDPALRYQRASELVAALAEALGQDPPLAFPPGPRSDTQSINAIVRAFYGSLSGPGRDWARFRSLFMPHATLSRSALLDRYRAHLEVMTMAQYEKTLNGYLEGREYYEQELARRVEEYGNIAHVWSTFESTYEMKEGHERHSTRGINSFQLFWDGYRWWISGLVWDMESETNLLPAAYLEGTMIALSPDDPSY